MWRRLRRQWRSVGADLLSGSGRRAYLTKKFSRPCWPITPPTAHKYHLSWTERCLRQIRSQASLTPPLLSDPRRNRSLSSGQICCSEEPGCHLPTFLLLAELHGVLPP